MITRDADAFLALARTLAHDAGVATARGAFLVAPDGFRRAEQSAIDNRYMSDSGGFDRESALHQHRELQRALGTCVPTVCFSGHADMPDATFPNNVFATARTPHGPRFVIGRMRHEERQREATRADIRGFFTDVLGYPSIDLSTQPHPCELTGALVIDRSRGVGFAGLSERCDEAGARLMHDAFGLHATFMFDLADGEYHTNVILAVLAGRAALLCPRGFAQPGTADAIARLYAPHAIILSDEEHAAFVANAIALSAGVVWMSRRADGVLRPSTRSALAAAGFEVRSVELDAVEAAGGSLRCCVAEIF